jgi:hypothetical protein
MQKSLLIDASTDLAAHRFAKENWVFDPLLLLLLHFHECRVLWKTGKSFSSHWRVTWWTRSL